MTDFPEFKSDDEMAEWFETQNVSADNLEPATDVVVSPDMTVTVMTAIYELVQPHRNTHSTTASAIASNRDANQDLVPA